MMGMKLLELPLIHLCQSQSAPLEPAAEIGYQHTFALYRDRSVTLVGEKLRKAINMGCDWPNAEAWG